jgi:hypothetical protein
MCEAGSFMARERKKKGKEIDRKEINRERKILGK